MNYISLLDHLKASLGGKMENRILFSEYHGKFLPKKYVRLVTSIQPKGTQLLWSPVESLMQGGQAI